MLAEINANIQQDNKEAVERNRADGRKGAALTKGTKRPKTAKNFFKEEEFVYKAGKGMSGLWYAESILKDYVFPYYCSVRDHNPTAYVYLVQDNVYLHGLGLRYCAPEIEQYSIKFAPQPPNSPDLHPIERCFGRLEAFLDGFDVPSGSKSSKQMAKDYIKDIWQHNENMRRYMAEKLHPQYFIEVADKCLEAGGNNNFTA